MENIVEIINRLNGYIGNFASQKNLNEARKAAEAFCKIILLNSDDENLNLKASETKLQTLIDSLPKNDNHIKKIKIDLNVVQTIGNINSHDNDELFSNDDFNKVLSSINSLLQLVFNSKDKIYIDQIIPEDLYIKIHKSSPQNENWQSDKIISLVYPNRRIEEKIILSRQIFLKLKMQMAD